MLIGQAPWFDAARSLMIAWMRRHLLRHKAPPSDIAVARELIAAIDRGGIPLNPARINAIARNLGLEVSVRAPVAQTVDRVRAWLQRIDAWRPLD